ncbi:metallophosphoesterase [Leucobacter sp. OLCS4]|uniref:purple acid phosphatase family protein n=1 Tax=Leucobacter sp. OLCS4 TaxID=1914918 RepID=UPI000C38D3A3|nr:metallophosphoesterase family protein [Leucobacter sp. OLCS4]PIJ01804.1 metallophosphoesterase [Leucobacter sp. OLCS4]
MTRSFPAVRTRRSTTALAIAGLIGGLVAPAAVSAASAAPTTPEVPNAPLVSTGTTWKYLDDNTDPARGDANLRVWTTPNYDDGSWKSAPTGFGVKNNALVPVGPFTPVTKLNHYIDGTAKPTIPTYFFRTTFSLDQGVAKQIESLASTVVYDDALVVWVNGTKVATFEGDRITETTNLEYAGSGKGDPQTSTFSVDGKLLHDGTNTIAVALHQDRDSSSDAYFDMPSLTAVKSAAPGEVVQAAPGRVILTPTATPTTSQAFSWQAGDVSHTVGKVELGPAGGGDTRTVDAYSAGTVNNNAKPHFSATVDGLAPATAYRYRVGLPGSWSEWFEFTTADPKATDFQFVYYGDAQVGLDTTWPSVVKQAEAKATRSIGSVHAGDLINTGTNDTEWNNWFKGMAQSATRTNVMAAPGNHEYTGGDNMLKSWKAHFEYPLNQPNTGTIGELAKLAQGDSDVARQYAAYFAHWTEFAAETVYYTDYQNVRFITLNATRDTAFLKPANLPACTGAECPSTKVQELWTQYQAAWLDHVLKNSQSKWNVVTFHQPVYSTSSGRDEPVLRKYWVPVFEENGVDLVLMGHDHTYGRGYKNSDKTGTTGLTTGPVYAVSNSGAKHYDLATEEKNVWTNNGATQVIRGENVTTYQVIDVSGDQLVYRSYLAEKVDGARSFTLVPDAAGERPVYAPNEVPAVGGLYDEFTVTKYATGEKWVTEAGVETPAGPKLSLGAASVPQGGKLAVSGSGFVPGTKIGIELHSTPVPLAEATVGDDRAFSQEVAIPANAEAGEHRIVAKLPNGAEVSAPLSVTAVDGGAAAGTDGGSSAAANGSANSGSGSDAGSGAAANAAASGSSDVTGTASSEATIESKGNTDGANPGAGKTDGLATTGGAEWLPLGIVGAGLLAAGAILVLARRRAAVQQ